MCFRKEHSNFESVPMYFQRTDRKGMERKGRKNRREEKTDPSQPLPIESQSSDSSIYLPSSTNHPNPINKAKDRLRIWVRHRKPSKSLNKIQYQQRCRSILRLHNLTRHTNQAAPNGREFRDSDGDLLHIVHDLNI